MRYVGQGHEIRVPLPAGVLDAAQTDALALRFREVYRTLYERLGPPVAIEVLNWRVVSAGPKPEIRLAITTGSATNSSTAIKDHRPAYFPEAHGYVDTPVFDRYALAPGAQFVGPAIVEERESTVIIGPGAHCVIDAQHNLVCTIRGAFEKGTTPQ
jgi:N-methylhydantoinase A